MDLSATITAVFVYGTLKRDQVRGRMWPRMPLSVRAATMRGALYDMGQYPGLVPGNQLVLGEVWEFAAEVMPVVLRGLDEIEDYGQGGDDLYVREVVAVEFLDGGTCEAYTYFFNQPSQYRHLEPLAPNARGYVCWPAG